jgi:curved DNA-binding protein CbpA
VVDGLRQSWHPDHAKDEPDRQRREERIKQINIAWDLIEAETKERAA